MSHTDAVERTVDVLLLTALGLEAEAVAAHLQELRLYKHPALDDVVMRGTIRVQAGLEASAALAQVGVGHIEATRNTQRLVRALRPSLVLFVGVAGGVKDVLHGDVVVATKVSVVDYGKFAAGGFLARAEQYRPSSTLISVARALSSSGIGAFSREDAPPVRVLVAPMAAVNAVVAERGSLAETIRRSYGDVVALSMEDGGFLAALDGSGSHGLVVRGISDLLDDKNETRDEAKQPTAAANAAQVALEIVRQTLLVDALSSRDDERAASPTMTDLATHPLPLAPEPFIGRDAQLERCRQDLLAGPGALAVTGIAGVGKTSFLSMLARTMRDLGYNVLWFDASDGAALDAAVREQLPESSADPLEALRSLLAADSRSIVLVDNPPADLAMRLLPARMAGALTVASRIPVWPAPWKTVDLRPLSAATGLELLQQISAHEDSGQLRELADFVQGLPLGLVHVGLFLRATGMPPGAFLDRLSARTARTLTQAHVTAVAGVHSVVDEILDSLDGADADAVPLAAFWAHLPPVPIYVPAVLEAFDRGYATLIPGTRTDGLDVARLIVVLGNVGLLRVSGVYAQMHSLTSSYIQDSLRGGVRRAVLFEASMITLEVATSDDVSNAAAVMLLRHGAKLIGDTDGHPWVRVLMLLHLADRLRRQGLPQQAVQACTDAWSSHEALLADDADAATRRDKLRISNSQFDGMRLDLDRVYGLALSELGSGEATKWLSSACRIAERLDDPAGVARAHNDLGRGYYNLHLNDSAVEEFEHALAIYEAELPEHPGQFDVLLNSVRSHISAGDHEAARRALHRFKELASRVQPPAAAEDASNEVAAELNDDFETQYERLQAEATIPDGAPELDQRLRSISRNNLALLLAQNERHDEALAMMEASLADARHVWGERSQEVGIRMRHLARLLSRTANGAAALSAIRTARELAARQNELLRCSVAEALIAVDEGRVAEASEALERGIGSSDLPPGQPLSSGEAEVLAQVRERVYTAMKAGGADGLRHTGARRPG